MSREETLLNSEEQKDTQEVVDFLRELAESLENRKLTLKKGSDEVDVEVPSSMEMEIELEEESKKRGIKHELEIELEWYDEDQEGEVEIV